MAKNFFTVFASVLLSGLTAWGIVKAATPRQSEIVYNEQGEPVASGPVEMTSQGPQVNGLDAGEWISAGC